MEFLTKKTVREIRKAVNRQTYKKHWKPLSDTWALRKRKLRLDKRMWKASGQTMDSIQWWHSKKHDCWFVGVHPLKRHNVYKLGGIYSRKKQKARIIDIIRWLELGTRKSPPRPLFGPVLKDIRRDIPKLYQEYIRTVKGQKSLKKALTSSGTMPNITATKKKTKKKAAKKATKKVKKTATKKVLKKASKKATSKKASRKIKKP